MQSPALPVLFDLSVFPKANERVYRTRRSEEPEHTCQSLPPDTPGIDKVKGIGFCSPTYFIFQMRIDNHATPWANGPTATAGAGFGAADDAAVEAQ